MSSSGVLGNRRFLALWAGNGVSLVGMWGVRFAYPLLVLATTGSPALAGWVTFAVSLPAIVFQLPAGTVADHHNRRRVMFIAGVLGLAATATAAVAIAARAPGLVVLLMFTGFIEGTALVFFTLAELGAIRDIVTEQQRTSAFAFYEAEQPVAILAGRAFGAALFGLGRWLPFAANAASYLFCLTVLAALPHRLFAPRRAAAEPVPMRPFAEGLRWAWSVRFLRISTLVTGLSNVLFQMLTLLVIVVATRRGQPAWSVGVILASAGVGGLAGSFAAAWLNRRFPTSTVYGTCVWIWSALLLIVALDDRPVALVVALGGVGAVGTIASVALTMAQVGSAPEAVFGRVVGAIQLITDGSVPVGAVVAGYVIALLGTRATGWMLFVAMLALAVLATSYLWLYRSTQQRRPDLTPSRAMAAPEFRN
jgi:MFS family permease